MPTFAPNALVPATDTADNVTSGDVIGSKLDRTYNGGNSIYAMLNTASDHIHNRSRVWPSLANGITLVSGNGAWTLGAAFVEVMPAGTAAGPFDVHFVNVEDMDTVGVYELVLYHGAADDEYCRIRFSSSAVKDNGDGLPTLSGVIAPTERIRAKVAHSAGGLAECVLSLGYHVY